jgi:phosphomevalonate kinase
VKLRVPGKLMLAGEYAALTPGAPAVALAVAQYLEIEVEPAQRAELSSELLGLERSPLAEPCGDRVVDAALKVSADLLASLGLEERAVHYCFTSKLSGAGRAKPGLGSSAAATVALVAARLAAHGVEVATPAGRGRVLGLALVAHLAAQGFRGSGYDVATVTLGGVVTLRAPAEQPLAALAAREVEGGASWVDVAHRLQTDLDVTRAALPPGLCAAFVPSGESASTPVLMKRARQANPSCLAQAAEEVTGALALGATATLASLERAQSAFERWDTEHSLGLMTPTLIRLADEARSAGLVPRVSGAGGGDSLLVLSEDAAALTRRLEVWRAAGFEATSLAVDDEGLTLS